MIIPMTRPWRHPQTGVWYFRCRLPADLAHKVRGQSVSITVAGISSSIKLSSIVKVSMRTKDTGEARLRHALVQSQFERRWASIRSDVSTLSHKRIQGLAGVWYRELVACHQDDPGDCEGWDEYQDQLNEGLAYLDPDSDGTRREPYDPDRGIALLAERLNIDEFLGAHGLRVDQTSRQRLLEAVAVAVVQGVDTLKRRALGDYGPDKIAERFPHADVALAKRTSGEGASLTAIFDGWTKESQPRQATHDLWRSYVQAFIAFIGHDNAPDVSRSDIINWKQHLVEVGNSRKTINDGKLAALKAIFRWAVDNVRLPANPAAGVSIRREKKAGEKMLGFDKAEAAAILRAAAKQTSAVYRWVPLLCAQSGARVSEICQLRGEDIREESGIWFMSFCAEAGSLKTVGSERKVPLHPHVLEAGFLEFVKRKGKGPLFYDPKRRRPGAKKPQPKIVAKNVARWVHSLDIGVGRKARKDPNHAWRHLFRTLARDVGVDESVSHAITGHAASNVGQAYGETWLTTAARAIARLPLPGVSDGAKSLSRGRRAYRQDPDGPGKTTLRPEPGPG